ncbi:MAG: DMT family transporter [Dehalococcoidales bacterium]|nr:DMT family transporter [Dehalococcoidales bacterium]
METQESQAIGQKGTAVVVAGTFWHSRQLQADLSLLLVTAIWGTTFVLVKEATQTLPPLTLIALRFTTGFIALALVFHKRLRRATRQDVFAGLLIAFFLGSGFVAQTFGLQTTAASVAAFITGLNTVIVPVFAFLLLRHRPSRNVVLGVALATGGMALLTLQDDLSVSQGDLLVVMCAFFFALHIVAVGKNAPCRDTTVLAVIQVGGVAAAAWPLALLVEHPTFVAPPEVWGSILFLGVVATGLVFLIQNVAQRFTSPTHTALIFTMEPVFAAVFAYLWLGEIISGRSLLGAGLILVGMIVAELRRGQGQTADTPS